MLVCTNCGSVYEEEEVRRKRYDEELHYTEVYYKCHHCGDDELVEATECEICGEYFYDEEGLGICEECFEKNETVETALEYGAEREESVAINGAFYAVYTEEEINAILTKHFEEHFTDHSKKIIRFCEEDKSDFADWLIERNG